MYDKPLKVIIWNLNIEILVWVYIIMFDLQFAFLFHYSNNVFVIRTTQIFLISFGRYTHFYLTLISTFENTFGDFLWPFVARVLAYFFYHALML